MDNDHTDNANQQRIYCEAVISDELEQMWSMFIDPKEHPLQLLAQKMHGFNIKERDLKKYHQKFFEALEYVYKNQSFTQAN